MKKTKNEAASVDVAEVDPVELAGLQDQIDVESKFREWAARENPECLTIRTYVYKYENATTGDLKVQCDRIDGEDIPDPHQVGLLYGSGRYLMIVSIPDGTGQQKKMRALRFRLHSRYDEMLKSRVAAVAVSAVPAAPAVNGLRDGIDLIKSVVEVLKPLLDTRQASGPDVSKLLEGNYNMMAGVLSRSLASSQELIDQVNRAKIENAPQSVEPDEPDFLVKIMPLVEKFLPLILGGGAGAAGTAAVIRGIPEVAKVVNNAGELRRVVSWLDGRIGAEKCNTVLKALKVRRPNNGKVVSVPAAAAVVKG